MDKRYALFNSNATLKKNLTNHDKPNKKTEQNLASDKVFNMSPALRKSTRTKKITSEETNTQLTNCIYKFDESNITEPEDLSIVSNNPVNYVNEFEEIDSMKYILDKFEARTLLDYKNQILKLHEAPIFEESMKNYLSKMIDDSSDENKNIDNTDIKKYTGYYSEFFGVKAPLVYYHDLDGDIYEAQYCQTENVSEQQNVDVMKLIKCYETGAFLNTNKNEEKTETEDVNDKIQRIFEEVNKIREENQKTSEMKICENEKFDLDIILPPPIQFQTFDSSSIHVSSSPSPLVSSSVLGSTNEPKAISNLSPEQFSCNPSESEDIRSIERNLCNPGVSCFQ